VGETCSGIGSRGGAVRSSSTGFFSEGARHPVFPDVRSGFVTYGHHRLLLNSKDIQNSFVLSNNKIPGNKIFSPRTLSFPLFVTGLPWWSPRLTLLVVRELSGVALLHAYGASSYGRVGHHAAPFQLWPCPQIPIFVHDGSLPSTTRIFPWALAHVPIQILNFSWPMWEWQGVGLKFNTHITSWERVGVVYKVCCSSPSK
jgi:hypothetical protein